MDIEKEHLEIKCPYCQQDITLTFNTFKCPKCEAEYNPEEVKQVFYEYESILLNSKSHQYSQTGKKVGQEIQDFGGCIQNIGCIIMLIPIVLILLFFAFSL